MEPRCRPDTGLRRRWHRFAHQSGPSATTKEEGKKWRRAKTVEAGQDSGGRPAAHTRHHENTYSEI